MTNRQRLSEKLVKAAEPRARAYQLFDDDVLGFSAVIQRTGSRGFCLDFTIKGRPRRMVIGRWPEWSVVAARDRAKQLRREIDDEGHNAQRAAMLLNRYPRNIATDAPR